MPDDPVTLGELGRRMERGFADLQEDVHELAGRLDSKVANEVFALQIAAVLAKIQAVESAQQTLEADRKADAKRQDDRRWQVYLALLGSALAFVATLYFALRGP